MPELLIIVQMILKGVAILTVGILLTMAAHGAFKK